MPARRCSAWPASRSILAESDFLLAEHTTLRVGGPAREHHRAESEAALVEAVWGLDERGVPLLILGGGSNVLVGDEGVPGAVVEIASRGIVANGESCSLDSPLEDAPFCGGVTVTAQAGEPWDEFVALAVASEWIGIEALSGIPGLIGATPIQNVGAYGSEVADTIASVRTWDRQRGQITTFAAADCLFGYRHSRFKAEPGRYVVLSVDFQFTQGTLSAPVRYAELARTLGVEIGQRAPASDVREAVLTLRAGKGMVLDAVDNDTWSAGSFFTNPILSPAQAAELPEQAPRYAQADGTVKTSAAWLIDNAGFAKGYGTGPATLSTKHTLALTNRGQAKASDVVALAREIRAGVHRRFGIDLVAEPVLVGCEL